MRDTNEFSPLQVERQTLIGDGRAAYRVYKNAKEFILVEANTALEAFRGSGIDNPLKIEREMRFRDRLLDHSVFAQHASSTEELTSPSQKAYVIDAPSTVTSQHIEADAAFMTETIEEVKEEAAEMIEASEAEQMTEEPKATEEELSEDDISALLGDDAKS